MKRMKRKLAGKKSLRSRKVSTKNFHAVLLEAGFRGKRLLKGHEDICPKRAFLFFNF